MRTWETLLGLAVILGAVVIWHIIHAPSLAVREKKKRLGERPALDRDQFYKTFYESSGLSKDVVCRLRAEIAFVTGLPEPLLRPADRFLVELVVPQRFRHFDDSPDELYSVNRKREKRLGVKIDLTKLASLDDYIRTVGELEMQHGTWNL